MLNYEYKVLKYINKHPNIAYKELKLHFVKYDVDDVVHFLNGYVCFTDKNLAIDEHGNDTGENARDGESTIHISHYGNEYIEHKRHEFWAFFFPYMITTVIAITSIAISMR